jgi:tryptophan synthase alpha chain
MNDLTKLLNKKSDNLLSIFFTAGYPSLESTSGVLLSFQNTSVDFVEVGIPYSDPLADGPVIQQTSTVAIRNGMNMELLFTQLQGLKGKLRTPLVLMGYLNPVLQYGVEKFCKKARDAGVSGVILPDLPMHEYTSQYKKLFRDYDLHFIFLITPSTKEDRIREIDRESTAFIYAVSAASTTGGIKDGGREKKLAYFRRLRDMNLAHPVVMGFGIHDRATLRDAWNNASGAIIGTAYLQILANAIDEKRAISELINMISDH